MPINILMPALSPTMEKGNLAKWLKKVGDKIKSGDILAEIETDKATMEVEAVDEGVLAKILVPDGAQDVPVNQLIALIAGEGEDAATVGAGGGAAKAAPAAAPAHAVAAAPASAPAKTAAPVAAAAPAAANGAGHSVKGVFASPLARRIAKLSSIDIGKVQGSGPHGRVIERDVKAAIAGGGAAVSLNPQPLPPAQPGARPRHTART